jgi:hypothetical protein
MQNQRQYMAQLHITRFTGNTHTYSFIQTKKAAAKIRIFKATMIFYIYIIKATILKWRYQPSSPSTQLFTFVMSHTHTLG